VLSHLAEGAGGNDLAVDVHHGGVGAHRYLMTRLSLQVVYL
jgi:hypothetical protein